MNPEYRRKIVQAADANAMAVYQSLKQLGGVPCEYEELPSFLQNHPNFDLPYSLPEFYFQLGNSRNVYLNYHSPIFNGFPYQHKFFELIYVGEGSVQDEIGNTTVELNTGDICIHNPMAVHRITRCGPEDFLVNILISQEIFHHEIFAPIDNDLVLERFFLHYSAENDQEHNFMEFHHVSSSVNCIIDQIFEEYFHPQCSELLLTSLLTLLFGNLLRENDRQPGTSLQTYIQEHLREVTIHDMARHFGYSEKYLSKLIREKTGRTFKQLVTENRMRCAAHLLLYSSKSVEAISCEVGYRASSSFYMNFQETYGVSPRQYRLQHWHSV